MFRNAQLEDRPVFIQLFTEYLEELKQYGGELEPDLETLRSARGLFDNYTNGDLAGVCVLFDPPGEGVQGFTLVGSSGGIPMFPKRKFGKLATAWAIYLQPKWREKRIAQGIWLNTGKKLLALGFDTLIGDILVKNKVSQVACTGVGWEPHSVNYIRTLKELDHGIRR
jgi:hypothetical protein